MKKILFLFGTRPEAIKMSPLIAVFEKSENFKVRIAITAQHRELLDQVLSFFNIVPDYDLNIMTPNQTLHELTGRLVVEITDNILLKESFDYVFVQGDTTTVLAGSLAAYYQKIPVIHIEAGLRSFNKYAPFPEEVNRVLTSNLASLHFCPTEESKNNLALEGIVENVFVVGNTVIDALFNGLKLIEKDENELKIKYHQIDFSKKLILVTTHRRENFGKPLEEICRALNKLAEDYADDVAFILPVHPNPNVKKILTSSLKAVNIKLFEPLDYKELIWFMEKSFFVITDSGGIQEEAPSLGKPVIVLREVTERNEGVAAGNAILVGSSYEKILLESEKLLTDETYYNKIASIQNPYGDGTTSHKVLDVLTKMN